MSVKVMETAGILLEGNRQVRKYTIEIPTIRGRVGNCPFLTGTTTWSCRLDLTGVSDRRRLVYFNLVPGEGHSPVAHLSVSAEVINSAIGSTYRVGPFSPCQDYVKIDSNGLSTEMITWGSAIISISCCLKVDVTLSNSDEEKSARSNEVVIRFPKSLTTGLFSDVTIQVGEKTFPAHRFILSALSPAFLTMFSQPMKESQESKVEIEDCSPEAMEVFLSYLYSGSLSEDTSEDIFSQVLHLAHKYQIEELLNFCEIRLSSKLNLETAVESLKLADLYDLKSLEHKVLNFMKPKRKGLFATPAWKELEQSKPLLVIEIFKLWCPSDSSSDDSEDSIASKYSVTSIPPNSMD